MFKFLFGKKNTETLISSIAEKTAKNIADKVTNKDALKQKEIEIFDIEKKKLEIELLKMETKKKTEHHSVSRSDPGIWQRYTSPFRVKVDENDFKSLLLNHKEALSPQALQGKWQAYGQIRAARITACGAVFATGGLGVGLFFYQKSLSKQEKELDKKEKQFSNSVTNVIELTATNKILEKQLESADLKVKELCNGDQQCYSDYQYKKTEAKDKSKEEFEEIAKRFEKPFLNFR